MKKLLILTILIVSCGKKEPDNIEQKRTVVTNDQGLTCYYIGNTLDYCSFSIDSDQANY